ncbi:MAG: sugar ABC transporter permease, partial [Treponema sp.]|nr:sugar ABC transporter permease [Treponema sp.]
MKYQNYSYIKKAYPQYLVLCSLFIFCAFYLASVILSFFFSLTDWHIRQPDINFIGLKNFIKLFGDTRFLASFRNTFVYACITTLLKTVLGLIV